MLQSQCQEWLRRLALGDEVSVRSVMRGDYAGTPLLDDKTTELVRLACVVAAGSKGPALFAAIDGCHAAGVESAEIVEMVEAISPVIGSARARQATTIILTADGIQT